MMKTFWSRALATALTVILVVSLAVTSLAVDAKPSVQAKPAPEIKVIGKDGDGNDVYGEAIKGDSVIGKLTLNKLCVVPYASRNNITYSWMGIQEKDRVGDSLTDSFKDINKVGTLAELVPELDDLAKEYDPKYNATVFVVSDICEIGMSDDAIETLADGSLRVVLDTHYAQDEEPVVLFRNSTTGKWSRIKDSKLNDDGSLTVVLPSRGAIALADFNPEAFNPNPPTSDGVEHCLCPSWCPFCDHASPCYCWAILAALFAVIIALISYAVIASRKSAEEYDGYQE